MIFNQFEFLFLFMPGVLLATGLPVLRDYRVYTLTVASILFYGFSGIDHAVVLCAEILWVWCLAVPRHRGRLFLSIAGPVVALLYFKYTGFLFGSVFGDVSAGGSTVLPFLNNIALPAGISFFTFQVVGYAIDRYRGESRPPFSDFALFVSFFPQLVAGPIVRLHEVRERISGVADFRLHLERLRRAVTYCCVGLILKVALADSLANTLLRMGDIPADLSALGAWFGVFAYSFQIYFDFFGYSLIAIGLAQLFGIDLPDNFDRPYNALNPKDFWRRWHISLSFWIRDYLYLPLGGNRHYLRNIVIVFAICGLWHGAAWTFVAWGLYHAALVSGYGALRHLWDKAPGWFQWLATFVLVSVGWVFFRYDFERSADYFSSLAGLGGGAFVPVHSGDIVLLGVSAAIAFWLQPQTVLAAISKRGTFAIMGQTTLAAATALTLFAIQDSQTFIYFRF